MNNKLSEFLTNELIKQYGEGTYNKIIEGYNQKRFTTLRVNTLKAKASYICSALSENNIEYEKVSWNNEALIIKNANEIDIKKLKIYKNGEIYLQSLSSMMPAIILEPKENEDILDMTAAPGGKTTQIAALTNNKANITACEMNTVRADRLKYNVEKQGATSVTVLKEDSRRLNDYFSFDKILLDAPCSGSGTILLNNERTYKNFSENLVKKTIKSQKDLLKKAIKILKPGHELVYSTCSILKQENENIIKEIIEKGQAEVMPINEEKLKDIPKLKSNIDGALTVCPNEYYEGFFVAKLRKL